MKVNVTQDTTWKRALNAARRTIGKEPLDKEPGPAWEAKVLLAEHSPIKLVEYCIQFSKLRQWVGVHLLRHQYMIPMIHSQRSDRRDLTQEYPELNKILDTLESDIKNSPDFNPRDYLPQGELNDQDFYVNAQTLINISRKRLCGCSSHETREAWKAVKDAIAEIDPVMASKMVPNCIYRGFCPELKCCGFCNSPKFPELLAGYRREALGNGQKQQL